MKFLFLIILAELFMVAPIIAAVDPKDMDPFYDFNARYDFFEGRVSDRDTTSSIFKISSTNANIKYFKVGDPLRFQVSRAGKGDYCEANVRDVEHGFIVIYVKNLGPCWPDQEYMRRGTILHFNSDTLARRVEESSLYRMVLLKRREDFFKQMNEINHFIWSYDQQKILLASEFDKKIVELQQQKQKAIDELLNKKKYNIHLQKELAYRLDVLDKDIEFYRITPTEGDNLWQRDQHLGKSVGTRPQAIKESTVDFDEF
jgi:hypothetical protein